MGSNDLNNTLNETRRVHTSANLEIFSTSQQKSNCNPANKRKDGRTDRRTNGRNFNTSLAEVNIYECVYHHTSICCCYKIIRGQQFALLWQPFHDIEQIQLNKTTDTLFQKKVCRVRVLRQWKLQVLLQLCHRTLITKMRRALNKWGSYDSLNVSHPLLDTMIDNYCYTLYM